MSVLVLYFGATIYIEIFEVLSKFYFYFFNFTFIINNFFGIYVYICNKIFYFSDVCDTLIFIKICFSNKKTHIVFRLIFKIYLCSLIHGNSYISFEDRIIFGIIIVMFTCGL